PGTPTSLTNPNNFPGGIYTVTNGPKFESDTTDVGVYLVDDIQILPWLRFLAGARFDNFSANLTNYSAGNFKLNEFSRTDQLWSPRAAIVAQPTPNQTYYFSWGQAYNPSAEQLNSINAANQNTDPEQNNSYELGAKISLLDNRLAVTGALFRI